MTFLVMDSGADYWRSLDGITWVMHPWPYPGYWSDTGSSGRVAYDGRTTWVVVMQPYDYPGVVLLATSLDDGLTWTTTYTSEQWQSETRPETVTYGDGIWLANTGFWYLRSTDGVTWEIDTSAAAVYGDVSSGDYEWLTYKVEFVGGLWFRTLTEGSTNVDGQDAWASKDTRTWWVISESAA